MFQRQSGFTLLELIVVFAILALTVGLAVPAGAKMFATMQYRETVREVRAAIDSARYKAITSGKSVDLMIHPDDQVYSVRFAGEAWDSDLAQALSSGEDIHLSVISAEEVSPGDGLAAVRFFPEGGATGGSVVVERESGAGVRLRVGWLMGRVSEEPLESP